MEQTDANGLEMKVEWWPIDRPKPYSKNPRKWSAAAVQKVASSIKNFGWRQPMVCDVEDVICIGHLRLAAAKFLKLDRVPVHVAANLTPDQIKALRIADNRLHEEADWNMDLLKPDMMELKEVGFDLTLTGFDIREVDKFTTTEVTQEEEATPEPPANPVSRPGDIWIMGDCVCPECGGDN